MSAGVPAEQQRIVLAAHSRGEVTADLFRLERAPVSRPAAGEVLIRVLAISIDPAMRRWTSADPGYRPPIPPGGVMSAFTVGRIAESRHAAFRQGEVVYGSHGWQEWAISDGSDIDHRVSEGVSAEAALGVLGHTGLTGYLGLLEAGRPKAGETVLVTTAAGAVGSVVGQIARIRGARAVGLTGSPEKVRIASEEFGFDAVIDYRAETDLAAAIRAAAPRGIDVFFDSVSGPLAEAVFPLLNVGARIVQNGTIGLAADGKTTGPRLARDLLTKRASWHGFLVLDHFERFPAAIADLSAWIAAGRLRHREEVFEGLAAAPDALLHLLAGRNLGKVVVRLA